jgi:pimeloyl-ACP methyl ester carboxylesterase
MVEHRTVEVGDLRLHIAEVGEGPLVLLLHGFPECWYSWRHQFAPLAHAGYRVVAPDQRGYARSDRPAEAPRPISTLSRPSSPKPGSPAPSTGTATSTATGS